MTIVLRVSIRKSRKYIQAITLVPYSVLRYDRKYSTLYGSKKSKTTNEISRGVAVEY